jgi:hypothetical protein
VLPNVDLLRTRRGAHEVVDLIDDFISTTNISASHPVMRRI